MKIFIGLFTEDEALRRQFGLGKDAVVPKDSICRGYFLPRKPTVALGAWTPDAKASQAECERFLLGRVSDSDACMLLVEKGMQELVENIRSSTFTIVFDSSEVGGNAKNFFHRVIGRALRSFGQLLSKFDRGDDSQLLTLPIRNFDAEELRELTRLCRDDCFSATFSEAVENQLVGLRKRVRPRRRSSYKKIYAVDNRDRFFEYGKERHSQFATGEPHQPHCEMAGLFRFGRRIDARRHYNVSETEGDVTKVDGKFVDCHGQVHTVKDRTHLNMFANDYF